MVTQSDIDDFRAGIEPIAQAGKLAALLAQFPPSFKSTPASVEYLGRLLRLFGDYPLAVELRHSSWSDAFGATLQLLNSFGAAWVQIDEPKFRWSIRQNALPNVKGFYYMRLHGRNAAQWWRHDNSEERYNYLYSAEELKEVAETAVAARALVKKVWPVYEQPLRREVNRERGDAERTARRADRGRVSTGTSGALPGHPRSRGDAASGRQGSTVTPPDDVGHDKLPRDVHPRNDLSENGEVRIQLRLRPERDVDLAVRSAWIAGVSDRDRPEPVLACGTDLGNADRRATSPRSPSGAPGHVAR